MANQKLYMVHGMGNDSIGLVERIAAPIAAVKGNIVDLRQDVMHGLFTVYLVVDLAEAQIKIAEFTKLVDKIADETGLTLFMDKYVPVPRQPRKVNILVVLLGHDRPGIIAAISEGLKRYTINIEFSQMVAREGVFLMELQVDISRCTVPVENLKSALRETMARLNISTMFQVRDVFNKEKRIIVFDYSRSMMPRAETEEIMRHCGITRADMAAAYPVKDPDAAMRKAASLVEGLPEDLVNSVIASIEVSQPTMELLQTLKTMGYRIVLSTGAFTLFTDYLKETLDISYAFGCPLAVNDDRKVLTGEIDGSFFAPGYRDSLLRGVMAGESVEDDDVTRIADEPGGAFETPGIGVSIGMKVILDYYNQHIISKENVMGLLGFFGPPAL
jgi:predicted amino acid-binding ACT domain protein